MADEYTKKPPEEIKKRDVKVEISKEKALKIQKKIEFLPIQEISKRRGFPPLISEKTKTQINRFDSMTNLFDKKVHECSLNGIKRDILEAENLTRSIDQNIKLPHDYQIRYYRLLDRYNNSIKFLEKNCKCKPVKLINQYK